MNVDAGATATAAVAPPPPSEQLVSVLTPMRNTQNGTYTLRLELKPPELGRVEMRVEMRDGVLHASIHAEHEGSGQLLRDALGELRDRLDAGGVQTGALTVSDGSVGSRAGQGGRGTEGASVSATGAADDDLAQAAPPHSSRLPTPTPRRRRCSTSAYDDHQERSMTAIPPTSSASSSTQPTTTPADSNQLNQDTFLKLLVAQMKYQDPLSPTDSTQFLTQTAQFTTVSTLQQIEADQQALGHTNELLAASGMVGRGVSYSTTGIAPSTATATTNVSVGGNLAQDAPVGAHVNLNTTMYNNVGTKVPLQLQFTRTADGWSVQPSSGGNAIGSPQNVTFDATGRTHERRLHDGHARPRRPRRHERHVAAGRA